MKLQNKETGEIGILLKLQEDDDLEVLTDNICYRYKTLAEVANHWEDYEEPKDCYFIYENGSISHINWNEGEQEILRKSIGNYFDTREEAEKAVEKLKAWKRLKDKGFRFTNYNKERIGIDLDYISITALAPRDKEALDLLFGGEE